MGNQSSGTVTVTQVTTTGREYSTPIKREQDDVYPASDWSNTEPGGHVKLRMGETGISALKPTTLMTMFNKTLRKYPQKVALGVKRDDSWLTWTYQQYHEDVLRAAKSFIKLGLEPHSGVGILGFNSPEWLIAHMGAIFAGGLSSGIYATNTPEACKYVIEDCKANIVVVENHDQLKKILKIWNDLPHLKAVVQYSGEVAERRKNIFSWEEFLDLSKDVPQSALQDRTARQAPNTCCCLIYTSGTTGDPKAVMLSHDNITWTAESTCRRLKFQEGQEVGISYLPLSHIAAQVLDIYLPILSGASIYFAQPDALKGSLVNTMKEVRPTMMFGVPRVWEKIMEKLQALGKQVTGFKKKMSVWAKDKGLKGTYARMNKESMPWGFSLANALVFKRIHAALGLDRCRFIASGAAPITKVTLDYFASLNLTILEVYGMSESTGPHTFCSPDVFRLSSVGKELDGVRTRLDQPDDDGNGEICYWGRHVFMGYLNKPEKTKEAIGDDGWLRSGDVGKKDKDGFMYITGRIKELLITAGGENVAPVPIEDAVKEELPIVSNCMAIGDKKKFLSMIITLKCDVDPNTAVPQNTLTKDCQAWCHSHGSSVALVTDTVDDVKLQKAIQAGIDRANNRAVSRAAKIQKWSILPRDFSIPGGELGPTMKLRRPIVLKMYEKTISAFYAED